MDSTEPRSSNLRLRKTFTDKDRDQFLDDAFEFMARFFENSLEEIGKRNPGIEGSFKRIGSSNFTASLYRNGSSLARCQICLGGYVKGITFAHGYLNENSYNESLSVEEGEQSLYLRPMGMPSYRGVSHETHLSFEGAAEYLWSLFIEPAQR
jgi:hypothetical protein